MNEPAPIIIDLPITVPDGHRIVGLGAYLKNTLCSIQGGRAAIHGPAQTLENPDAIRAFEKTARALWGGAKTVTLACDWHPDFPSSRLGRDAGLPLCEIQHHHAHIAAVMAEYQMTDPVLGLALDGFGLGGDQQSWGGELLMVNTKGFQRLGHLRPIPQPGGDKAARETWRMGAAALWSMGRGNDIASRYASFQGASMLASMMEKKLNAPLTSSAGRLFDAACGLLNVVPMADFEGQAPMALENMVQNPAITPNGYQINQENGLFSIDFRPLLAILADLPHDPDSVARGADLFHGTLASGLADMAARAAEQTGIKNVALSGGCFFNRHLTDALDRDLRTRGLTPLTHKTVSPGDAGLSLGQAYAALMRTYL